MRYLIATTKSWNLEQAKKLQSLFPEHDFDLIQEKEFLKETAEATRPEKIFFPHWSWIIPKSIYDTFECIVFHMTDLPFGRGGSPLQNLISRGVCQTKISAIRVVKEVDAGPIYLKEDLSLYGAAEEIYIRASETIFQKMIPRLIQETIVPHPQKGKVTTFSRRTPKDSNLSGTKDLKSVYDHIRMLDAEGYPPAYLETEAFRFEINHAILRNGSIEAHVRIRSKKEGPDE